MTLCPDKQRYPSAWAALRGLAWHINQRHGHRRLYECPYCHRWHLTGKPLRTRRWRDWRAHGGLVSMLKLPGHEDAA